MKRFFLSMMIGVGLTTFAAVVLARMLLPATVWEGADGAGRARSGAGQASQRARIEGGFDSSAPFTQEAAVEVVAARLGSSAKADRLRQTLRVNAKVEYHSPQHWTVRLNEATWTAHGAGSRYAEPENDAAREFEHESTGP
jgi:hypothetical protein